MEILLNIIKEKITYFEKEISSLVEYGEDIKEFCNLHSIVKNIKLSKKEKIELQKIVDRINKVQNKITKEIN